MAVSTDGNLVAIVEARLPSRVKTAGEAEARALLLAVMICPFTPMVVTDCLALLAVAQGGVVRATAANRTLAGVWTLIAAALDGDIQHMVDNGSLKWMPAHMSHARRTLKSDGSAVSELDLRANRLVDAVAKAAAGSTRAATLAVQCLSGAGELVRHEAAVLGATTRAANRYRTQVLTSRGHLATVFRRDSAAAVAGPRAPRAAAACSMNAAMRPAAPLGPPAALGSCRRKRPYRPEGADASSRLAAKRRRVAACAAEREKMVHNAVAARIVSQRYPAAIPVIAALAAPAGGDAGVGSGVEVTPVPALASAIARVLALRAASPAHDPHARLAALRARVAAKQSHASAAAP